jgi:MinD superfamily P-loop ATPase
VLEFERGELMKTIATINFKGGVGKTTCTWALGHVAAQSPNISSLDSPVFEEADERP